MQDIEWPDTEDWHVSRYNTQNRGLDHARLSMPHLRQVDGGVEAAGNDNLGVVEEVWDSCL